ncbi:chromosomal replication initiator protein DnaA [Planctomycetota bacterium]
MAASPSAQTEVWALVLDYVRAHVKPQQFETWFQSLRLERLGSDGVVIVTPNTFYKRWMDNHYRDLLERACSEVLEGDANVVFTVGVSAGEPEQGVERSFDETGQEGDRSAGVLPHASADLPSATTPRLLPLSNETSIPGTLQLNPQYTFPQFVVGPSNRLAHAACLAVVENPAQVYNPLFLHGDVGLGKTHLLQAVSFGSLDKNPAIRIVYLSCEAFVNEYISALQGGELELFRNRYRNVDLLLIDDIHFLASKKALQEEFFHTFNALHTAQKQIILSSDASPHEIPDLEARLVSRFKWGLVAEVEPPQYETKAAIIRRKAKIRGKKLADEVVDYLATTLDSNIRELEGAVLKIIVMAGLQNQDIDVQLCKVGLKELTPRPGQVSITEIMSHVANHFHLKISDLQGKKRSKSIVLPRQICMYLGRSLTPCSLEELGGHFGGRDHTTVLYSEGRIRELMKRDPEMRTLLERFARELKRA